MPHSDYIYNPKFQHDDVILKAQFTITTSQLTSPTVTGITKALATINIQLTYTK